MWGRLRDQKECGFQRESAELSVLSAGGDLANFDSGVQTVHHGHGKVEKNQVGRKLLNEGECLTVLGVVSVG